MTEKKTVRKTEMKRTEAGRFDGTPGPGRQVGSKNKTGATARENIELAADMLGGAQGLFEWASSSPQNTRVFWSVIYPKILPLQISSSKDEPLVVNLVHFSELNKKNDE